MSGQGWPCGARIAPRLLLVLGLMLLRTVPAGAQATSSSILGTVTDASGALVPNVTVTATQVDTNLTRSV
jgi:hypothetical protein